MQRKKPGTGKPKSSNIFERFKEEGRSGADGKKSGFKKEGRSSDRKPYKKDDKPQRSYSDKGAEGTEKKYSKRSDADSGRERKPFSRDRDEKPAYKKRSSDEGEKSSFREKRERPYGDKPRERSSDDRKPFSRDRDEKPAYKKRSSDEGEKSSFREKRERPYGDKPRERSSDDRKPFNRDGDEKPAYKRRSSDEGEKSSFREKRERPYGDKPRERSSNDRKPFSRDRDEKPAYKRRSSDEGEKNSFSEKRERPYGDKPRERSSDDRKPFNRDGDEKPAYRKRSSDEGEKSTYREKRESDGRSREPRPRTEKKSFSKSPAAADGKIRLNKYIANAGICSRREADQLIESGAVTVNGKIISELGYKVDPADIVSYGGTPIKKEKNVYVLLNKPKDYITTSDDPEGRKTVMELVKNAGRERIFPVGRLDRNTTGLLLLTNDGEVAAKLTHPKYQIRKVYHVHLDKNLKREDLHKIAEGIELEDGPIKVDAIEFVGDGSDKKDIGIELHSGKNRIVRRIFETLGYEVLRLDRVIFAGLNKKDLQRGRWRFLSEKEINYLKML